MFARRGSSPELGAFVLTCLLMVLAAACSDGVPTQPADSAVAPAFSTSTDTDVAVSGLSVASGKAYIVVHGGATNGTLSHSDQGYVLNAVPEPLRGRTLIRTAHGDRAAHKGSANFLSFTIDRDADIYVAHEDMTPLSWMDGFVDSGLDVVIQKSSRTGVLFSLYRKRFAAGKVTLGSNRDRNHSTQPGMYVVVIKPAGSGAIEPPPGEVASVEVSPTSASVDMDDAVQLTATARDGYGNVLSDATIAWSSSNTGVASVSSTGTVTGKAAGTAEITATSGGKSGTATVTVREKQAPSTLGIWISAAELAALPTSGSAWESLKKAADTDLSGGVLTVRDVHNVRVMAAALVAARLNDNGYRAKVRDALRGVMAAPYGTQDGLARNRRLGTYAVAADLIGLPTFDPATDADFRKWLATARDTHFSSGGGGTLAGYHERRPNNYGLHAGFSRVAVALYLGNKAEVERAAQVFRGYLGDRTAYAGFSYGSDLTWQADPNKPVGINPRGATKNGHNIDGVLPDDQRRCGSFQWPPCLTNYAWEGLQGAVALAWVLSRQGYDVWTWSDKALLRAVTWLHTEAKYPAEGDDTWQPHVINRAYGSSFPAPVPSRPGKNVGWTDWTH